MPLDTDVTRLLLAWSDGTQAAGGPLMDAVYDELRRLARGYLVRERRNHSLPATALVHEAYLKLVDQRRVHWQNRAHFFAVAASVMRRLLVDHARAHGAVKRGAEITVSLDGVDVRGRRQNGGSDRPRRGTGEARRASIRARPAWWNCGSSAD